MYPTVNREHVLRLASWRGVASGGQREAFLFVNCGVAALCVRLRLAPPLREKMNALSTRFSEGETCVELKKHYFPKASSFC